MTYIGNYAYTCKLGSLLKKDENEWLQKMERRNGRVSGYSVTEENRKAWLDCFRVLRDCAEQLPAEFGRLDVVFEYVLPRHQPGTARAETDAGIRPDVLLISDKTVMVLEFKQRSEVFMGHVRQARMYRTRIQKYHAQSIGMNKKTILVLTCGEGISEQHSKVSVRSRDLLSQEIVRLFEDAPAPHRDINAWLNSDFQVRVLKQSKQSD